MSIDVMNPFESSESMFKKWNLFEAIFGDKMKDLLDKVSKFLWGKIDTPPITVDPVSWQAQLETPITPNKIENKETPYTQNILWDMTDLASKYPNEAWAKNNNPSGITMPMSSGLRNKLDAAWIRYEIGSKRPSKEWGNYVKFLTMDEWIRAKKIVLMKWNLVVRDRLAKWVWHADKDSNYRYADWILKAAWIDWSKRFSELSDREMDELMMQQIKQESSGLYKELVARNVSPIASNIA